MSPETCRADLKRLINENSISTVAPIGSSVGALYQKLYIQSKRVLLKVGEFVAETCRAYLKILINEKVVASC